MSRPASPLRLFGPNPPWTLLQYGLPLVALITPVLFYPFSKTLFLALDLAVRPASREETRSR